MRGAAVGLSGERKTGRGENAHALPPHDAPARNQASFIYLEEPASQPGIQMASPNMDSLVPDFLPLHCKKSRGGRRPGSCKRRQGLLEWNWNSRVCV